MICPLPGLVIAQSPVKIVGVPTPTEQLSSAGLNPEPVTVTKNPGPTEVCETEIVGMVTVKVWVVASAGTPSVTVNVYVVPGEAVRAIVNWHPALILPPLTGQVAGPGVSCEKSFGVRGDKVAKVTGLALNPEPVTVTTVPNGPEFGDPVTGERVTVP